MKKLIIGLILSMLIWSSAQAEQVCTHHNSIAFEFDLCFDSDLGLSTGTKTWYRIFDVPCVNFPQEQRSYSFIIYSVEIPGPFRLINFDDGELKYLIEYRGQFYSVNPNPLPITRIP